MKIVLTGTRGLVGSHLVPILEKEGHTVIKLIYGQEASVPPNFHWDYEKGTIDQEALEGAQLLIHLAGENIAGQRWNEKVKERIRNSRIEGTAFLSHTLAKLKNPPQTFICASAIGFYGHRGTELMTEESPPGEGFLAECCKDWELATTPAKECGIRTICLRFGMILSGDGGALAKLISPFKSGLGGVIGDGSQFMSWITLDDVLKVMIHCINHQELSGPINCVTPNPVTNKEFTHLLGEALSRPTIAILPAFAAKLLFGEMANEVLLASTRAYPKKLTESGYQFTFPTLKEAFTHLFSS